MKCELGAVRIDGAMQSQKVEVRLSKTAHVRCLRKGRRRAPRSWRDAGAAPAVPGECFGPALHACAGLTFAATRRVASPQAHGRQVAIDLFRETVAEPRKPLGAHPQRQVLPLCDEL